MVVASLVVLCLWQKSKCDDWDDQVAEYAEKIYSGTPVFDNPVEARARAFRQADRNFHDPIWCAILDPD